MSQKIYSPFFSSRTPDVLQAQWLSQGDLSLLSIRVAKAIIPCCGKGLQEISLVLSQADASHAQSSLSLPECGYNDWGANHFLWSWGNPSCRYKAEVWKDRRTEGHQSLLTGEPPKHFYINSLWIFFSMKTKLTSVPLSKNRVVRAGGCVQLCQIRTSMHSLAWRCEVIFFQHLFTQSTHCGDFLSSCRWGLQAMRPRVLWASSAVRICRA